MIRRIALALSLALLALLVAAPAASAQQEKRGGVLRLADREAPGLDQHLSVSFLTHSWASLVYSQLVRFPHGPEQQHTADFTIVPDLAERWATSKDGTVYAFHLRRGARFHNKPPVNGREVTADDVKYSLERFMAKSGFRSRFEPVQSIDVVDRYTLRITLREPFARFSLLLQSVRRGHAKRQAVLQSSASSASVAGLVKRFPFAEASVQALY